MSQIARVGDIATGTCYSHTPPKVCTGPIAIGSPKFYVDGQQGARVGDTVVFDCGHTGIIATGSDSTSVDDKPCARIGDMVVGPMTAFIITGSPSSTV